MKIKFALAVSFLMITTASLHAQEGQESPYRIHKNELSFGLLGGGELSQNFSSMPSIGYKRFIKDGAIRVITGGTVSSTSDANFSENEASTSLRIGYQYHVLLGRFMPILGVDLMGGYFNQSYDSGFDSQATVAAMGGLSPNVGLEFWISPKLSLFMDVRFDVTYRSSENEYTFFDPWTGAQVRNKTTVTGINTHVAPISSFHAAFHF